MACKYSGKTLLVLGSNVMAKEIVLYAKKHGAHVIVADYYPVEKSEAKKYADESVEISTLDIDKLEEYALSKHVDGVISGISEYNILSAMELSERLGLKYYCNREQWNKIEKKNEFRKLCQKHGVPCPKEFFSGSVNEDNRIDFESLNYPLVVKPVDCCGSVGVHICLNKNEIKKAVYEATEESESKEIIIEEYVTGYEFTAHYTICDGKARLACVDNRYPVAVNEGSVTTIPIARIFPSLVLNQYISDVDPQMVLLCEDLGLKNAVIFIQGFYDDITNRFFVFEAGLRSAAECPCRFLEKITGQNYMYMLLDSIIADTVDYSIDNECPDLNGKCGGIISFVTKGGIVGKIDGLEEAIKNSKNVIGYENRYPEGTKTPNGNTLKQLMIRFVILCDNRSIMKKEIESLNRRIIVTNAEGEEMVLKMDPNRIDGLV